MTDEQKAQVLADMLQRKYGLAGAIERCVQRTRHPAHERVLVQVQARYADALAVLQRRQGREEAAP